MKIAIVEDNDNDYVVLELAIKNFLENNQNKMVYTIKRYFDLDDLYNNIYDIDLIFLDIECNMCENGINIGMKIRDLRTDMLIVFVSSYSEYLIDGYKAQANRYLLKPIKQLTFDIEMKSILKKYLFDYAGFYNSKISIKKIYFKDIMYVEFINRKTIIHFQDGSIKETNFLIKDWVKLLPKNCFEQTYRSIIVNFIYVCGMINNDIILSNNEKVPISRNCKNEFMQNYLKFTQWRI